MSCYIAFSTTDGVEFYRFTHGDDGRVVTVGVPDEAWRRITSTSPVVDGEFENQAVLAGGRLEVVLRLIQTTWAAVEAQRIAIRDTSRLHVDFLVTQHIDGVSTTYRANRPDLTSPLGDNDVVQKRRTVNLSFPVQPNPTVTGV